MLEQPDRKLAGPELAYAVSCMAALVWINAYVCRDLFFAQTAHMNSMHGFWAALARLAGNSWIRPAWWPYWDCGIPFEFTYAPLVPRLTAMFSTLRGIPATLGFQTVSGIAYCLGPLTLYVMAWLLTRAPGYSFLAALLYSLTAPTQLLVPDAGFLIRGFWDARRLYLVSVWDETPHVTALCLLPLTIVFLSLAIRRRRPVYYVAAALSIAAATSASAFGPTMAAMAAICLLFAFQEDRGRSARVILLIGVLGYAISAPFLPPSLFGAMGSAAAKSEGAWSMGSVTALGIVLVGWVAISRWLPRWTQDWCLRFFASFAYLTGSIPIIAIYLHRQFIPQPNRYKLEMELALAPLIVFAIRPLIQKAYRPLQPALLVLIVGLSGEQIVSHRKFAKNVLYRDDPTQTVEYRAATWAAQNLPGVRVMMPGSIANWANAFTDIQQVSGGPWSMAYSAAQQRGVAAIYNGGDPPSQDARVSLAWLQAFGAGAVAVSGPKSAEFWKPYAHPTKFEGVLPVLWRGDDVTIYRVPQRTASLAHVVPQPALVAVCPRSPTDTAGIERYVAALNDTSMAPADFQWQGRDRIHIRTNVMPGQAISIQVSFNSGWKAALNGRRCKLNRDGLGLMWIVPGSAGPCDVELDYTGSCELWLCRGLSVAGIVGSIVLLLRGRPGKLRHA